MRKKPNDGLANVSGVNYGSLDQFKKAAREGALSTEINLSLWHNSVVVPGCRGQSAFLIDTTIEMPSMATAFVLRTGGTPEGIGTKPLVAQAWQKLTGDYLPWRNIGLSSVAVMVNDAATMGLFVTIVEMHLAVKDGKWFKDANRAKSFLEGYLDGVNFSRATMGAGETAALSGIIVPGAIEISGGVHGYCDGNSVSGVIKPGQSIVMLKSSGIHDNGLTKARGVAKKITDGYLHTLPDGRHYGKALLEPTLIYLPVIEDLLLAGTALSGVINISGHGLRKLARYGGDLTYVIDKLYPVPDELALIASVENMTSKQAYAAFNMGNGYAVIVNNEDVEVVCQTAATHNVEAMLAGHIEAGNEPKVVLDPIGVDYDKLWED